MRRWGKSGLADCVRSHDQCVMSSVGGKSHEAFQSIREVEMIGQSIEILGPIFVDEERHCGA